MNIFVLNTLKEYDTIRDADLYNDYSPTALLISTSRLDGDVEALDKLILDSRPESKWKITFEKVEN
jgi:hypothetical protein